MSDMLQPNEVRQLVHLAADGGNAPVRRRARLLLLYHQGKPTAEVAREVGLSTASVLRWRRLFREKGMAVFPDGVAPAAPEAPPATEKAPAEAPAEAPGKDLQKAVARLVEAAREFVGDKKKVKKFKQLKTARRFEKFVAHLERQRKQLKKRLKQKKAAGKPAKKLKKQLRRLDGHLQKARKLLKKMT